MKLSFRWYGPDDKVTLENIRQIPGMHSIVTAVYDVPVGEVWSEESIAALKKQVEDAGLHFEVIESIPVHEDIKLGKPSRDRYIENYCENIRRVAKAGVKCICYNFMPVFDWTRTQLDHVLPDGSTSLVYYQEQVDAVNPLQSDSDLTLPGWDASYTREELKQVVAEYNAMSEDDLWNNLKYGFPMCCWIMGRTAGPNPGRTSSCTATMPEARATGWTGKSAWRLRAFLHFCRCGRPWDGAYLRILAGKNASCAG